MKERIYDAVVEAIIGWPLEPDDFRGYALRELATEVRELRSRRNRDIAAASHPPIAVKDALEEASILKAGGPDDVSSYYSARTGAALIALADEVRELRSRYWATLPREGQMTDERLRERDRGIREGAACVSGVREEPK